MIDFSKMPITHKQIGKNAYRLRLGNETIEATTYSDYDGFFRVMTKNHCFKGGKKPTNPRRTEVLSSYAQEYIEDLYRSEVESDLKDIASLPVADRLKNDFNGMRLSFHKGTTPKEIIQTFQSAYDTALIWRTGGAYKILKQLSKINGFLSQELEENFFF